MTPDEAINKLSEQQCPLGCGPTLPVVDADEYNAYATEICGVGHRWPYSRFSEDRSTNAFEGEFDPATVDEKLDEYAPQR